MDLREVLEDDGYEVVGECGNGREAVELVREHQPDLAIFDVKMPELDGIAAARELAADRICPVVLLTAFSQRQLIAEATEAGVMAYLVKPFQRQDLIPAIEVAIGRFAELEGATSAAEAAEERLRVRTLLDRAKAQLIESHGMSESAAFKFVQRQAMDSR
ncbi:UNVERIFIED_CONTAM: hypothetical protein GTU68_043202, partial [Idotea baltica]|nr:hypothetical protein [Idotea baltica]